MGKPKQLQEYAKALQEAIHTNKALENILRDMRKDYDELYNYLLAVLNSSPGRQLKIKFSQFLTFSEQYRLGRDVDKKEEIIRLYLISARDNNETESGK